MPEVGRLLASGRDSDIFEFGDGKVLRRNTAGRVVEHEAQLMQHLAEHGYPVPRVDDVRAGGTEIVMERLDGPTMLDAIGRRPNTAFANMRLLADLHDQLHVMPVPDGLPRLDGDGEALLHLDLHPMNVMLTARGPVVIDWANASVGHPLSDVGLTYAMLTCPRPPMPAIARAAVHPLRLAMAREFARRYRGAEFARRTAAVAELKTLDPHMSAAEAKKLLALAARMRARA